MVIFNSYVKLPEGNGQTHGLQLHFFGNFDEVCSFKSSQASWYTIWLFNIAMENGPFIDGKPIKNGDFPSNC